MQDSTMRDPLTIAVEVVLVAYSVAVLALIVSGLSAII